MGVRRRQLTCEVTDAIDATLQDVVELRGDGPKLPVSVVLFGSILDQGVIPGDVDVWLDGPTEVTRAAGVAIADLEQDFGLPFDVAIAMELPPSIRYACQWNAAQGLSVVGRVPDSPVAHGENPVATFQAAYQARFADEARAVISRAEVYRLLGDSDPSALVQLAARLHLRSFAVSPNQWRQVRRLSQKGVVRELASVGCEAPRDCRRGIWNSPVFVRVLREAIESRWSHLALGDVRERPATASEA